MARRLFAALALMLLVRAPVNWGLTLARWEKGPPQQYTLWARPWRKRCSALCGFALQSGWRCSAWRCRSPRWPAVMLEVQVSFAVPTLNTAEQHHVTFCRCGGRKEAGAVAARLQAAAAPLLCEKGILQQQLAKEAWLCRTARVLEGMQLLRRAWSKANSLGVAKRHPTNRLFTSETLRQPRGHAHGNVRRSRATACELRGSSSIRSGVRRFALGR